MDDLAKRLGVRLKRANEMLTTAESCTGGWAAQVVTSVAGSSAWFERGFVTYSNAAKQELLGVHDHGAMVWDEIVAFLLVAALLPRSLPWQVAGFVLFRGFDIGKPPPIRWIERRWPGGFGVMFDDLVAAGYTLLVLALVQRLFF